MQEACRVRAHRCKPLTHATSTTPLARAQSKAGMGGPSGRKDAVRGRGRVWGNAGALSAGRAERAERGLRGLPDCMARPGWGVEVQATGKRA